MNRRISFEYAEQLYEQEEYFAALQIFRNLGNAQTNADVQNYIGCCLLQLEQYSESENIFKTLIEKYPEWSRPVYNLGRVYMSLDEYDTALVYLKKSVEINHCDADAYYYLGVYFEKTGDYSNAILNYKNSLMLKPKEPEPHIGLSVCYDIIGDMENALSEAETAYRLYNCNDTLYNYTCLLNKSEQFELVYNLMIGLDVMSCNEIGLIKNFMFCLKKLNINNLCVDCATRILQLKPDDFFAKAVIEHLG